MYKTNFLNAFLIVLFLMMIAEISYGQTYGKLYQKADAEQYYGTVAKSFQFSTEEVLSFLKQTDKVLMFNITDNKLFILGDDRKSIYQANAVVSSKEVFSVYSISLIQELISKGKSNTINFEKRHSVLTISNGEYLLEFSEYCPPICP